MTSLYEILAGAEPIEAGFRTMVPPGWLQGRTAYGGLSTALALHAAMATEPNLPPLRSAQVAFIGPLSGEISVTAAKLRRGRNAAFIQADVASEAGLGLRATFVFMAPLASAIAHDAVTSASLVPPPGDAKLYVGPDNFFTGNFEFHDPKADLGPAEWLRWVRLRERSDLHPAVELLAIGDALPPAAYRLIEDRKTPLSSLNWQINLTDPAPATTDGWWLMRTHTERAADGYSSQRMTIWNADGAPVADAVQAVAIFG